MGKILLVSLILIVLVLGINSFWPSIGQFKDNLPNEGNFSDKLKLIQDFRSVPSSLPQKVVESLDGAVKGAQTGITEYFMQKTGGGIVEVLKDLPPEQQKEIKKEYCSN